MIIQVVSYVPLISFYHAQLDPPNKRFTNNLTRQPLSVSGDTEVSLKQRKRKEHCTKGGEIDKLLGYFIKAPQLYYLKKPWSLHFSKNNYKTDPTQSRRNGCLLDP